MVDASSRHHGIALPNDCDPFADVPDSDDEDDRLDAAPSHLQSSQGIGQTKPGTVVVDSTALDSGWYQ